MRRTTICTWNMTRTSRAVALMVLLLAAAGCSGAGQSESGDASAMADVPIVAAEQAGSLSASIPSLASEAQDQRIDPEAGPASASRIVASEDIEVAEKPACALTVQYAGDIEQPVTWRGEGCGMLTVRFVSREDLAAIGQDLKLDPGARESIAGLPGRKVLYIEGSHASAIFMPNEAGLLERHDLAD